MDRPATPASEQDTDAAGTTGTTAEGGDTAAPRSRALEIASAVVAVGATGAVVLLARAIEVRRETGGIDPRWWPELLGLLGLALAVVLLVVALVRPPAAREGIESPTREGRLRLGATVALAVVFVALWPVAGFLPTAPVFLCATTYVFGGRGWKPLVLYPLVLCGLVYLLFQTLLKVPL